MVKQKLIKRVASHTSFRSEKPLMTLRIDRANNVPKRSNLYFNKCFVFLTMSKKWTDSQKLIEELSVFFHTLPLFVIMVHSEDDHAWADPGSKTFNLRYPTLHLTREKVRLYIFENGGLGGEGLKLKYIFQRIIQLVCPMSDKLIMLPYTGLGNRV